MNDSTGNNRSGEPLESKDSKPKPGSRAKLSLIMIGVAFFSSLACMCLAVFALVAV